MARSWYTVPDSRRRDVLPFGVQDQQHRAACSRGAGTSINDTGTICTGCHFRSYIWPSVGTERSCGGNLSNDDVELPVADMGSMRGAANRISHYPEGASAC